MTITDQAVDNNQSLLLPPTYSSNFWRAVETSPYPLIPTPSPASDSGLSFQKKSSADVSSNENLTDCTKNPDIKHVFAFPDPLRPYRATVNSLFASVFAVTLGFPLDSVKTRLQSYKYKGNWACIVDTYKNEGVFGFYRGLAAPLVSSSLTRSWSISVFTYAKPHIHSFWSMFYKPPALISYNKEEAEKRKIEHAVEPMSKMNYLIRQLPVSLGAGMVAGLCTSVIASPFELTKLGLQIELVMRRRAFESETSQSSGLSKVIGSASSASATHSSKLLSNNLSSTVDGPKALGPFQIVQQLVKKGGFSSLYAGYRYMIFRDIIGSGIYFGVYESMRSAVSLLVFNSPESHPLSVAIGGALSGMVCWASIYPLDTLKSRYQRDVITYVLSKPTDSQSQVTTSNRKLLEYPKYPKFKFKELFHKNMYSGLSVSMVRTCMFGLLMFSFYEKLMELTA